MILKNIWFYIIISCAALEVIKAQTDSLKTAEYYVKVGNKFNADNQYEDAINNYLLAITILEKKHDSILLASTYTNIGVVNAKLKSFDKAINYLEKALNYIDNNEEQKLKTIFNISALNYDNKNITEALARAKEAEQIAKKRNDKKTLSALYNNYCNIYRELKNYNTAINYGLKSLKLKQESNLNPDIVINNIGYSYLLANQHTKAIEYLLKVKNTKNKPLQVMVYNNLRTAYKNTNRNNLALNYSDKLIALKDSLNSEQQQIKVASIIERYESDKKQQQIDLLNINNELQNIKLKNQRHLTIGITSFLLLLLSLIYLWYKNQKTRQTYKNTALQHKLLQTQLNPHFLFHALNSIQTFIYQNKKEKSTTYLARYSKLMRSILESSDENFITVEKDAEAIKDYLILQKLNYPENTELVVELDTEAKDILIPPMFIQPFVENALIHGIKEIQNGKIFVNYSKQGNHLLVCITDNGKGINHTDSSNNKLYKSMSSDIINNRINNLKRMYKYTIDISQKSSNNGTKIEVLFPANYNHII